MQVRTILALAPWVDLFPLLRIALLLLTRRLRCAPSLPLRSINGVSSYAYGKVRPTFGSGVFDYVRERTHSHTRTFTFLLLSLLFAKAETEKLHSMVRRYTVPDEHAFFPKSVAPPVLSALNMAPKIMPNPININDKIK